MSPISAHISRRAPCSGGRTTSELLPPPVPAISPTVLRHKSPKSPTRLPLPPLRPAELWPLEGLSRCCRSGFPAKYCDSHTQTSWYCSILVRSKQSKQFVRNTPVCNFLGVGLPELAPAVGTSRYPKFARASLATSLASISSSLSKLLSSPLTRAWKSRWQTCVPECILLICSNAVVSTPSVSCFLSAFDSRLTKTRLPYSDSIHLLCRSKPTATSSGPRVSVTFESADGWSQKVGTLPRTCTMLSQPPAEPGICTSCSVSTQFATSPSSSSPRALYRVPARRLLRRAMRTNCSRGPPALHSFACMKPCITGVNQRADTPCNKKGSTSC
mmetsp:Transcript_19027/g.34906  ORF Transcript_19027/g.34906 Transcript_19027/m.34906 type:complete len:329 (+) Transcript_19027:354-1340(+)